MKIEVHQQGGIRKIIDITPGATVGATIGVDVYNTDGTLFVPATGGSGGQVSISAWELILNIPPNVVALANTATTGLYVITGSGTSATRSIVAGDGISVADGSGVAGNPTVYHGDTSSVTDVTATYTGSTVPSQISFTFDQFGHVLTHTFTGRQLDHNEVNDIQGGSATERYHFTAAQHAGLIPWSSAIPADYALITQTITNGDTTHAPSGNAVFDALGTKEPTIAPGTTGQFFRGDKAWSDTLIGNLLGLSGTSVTEVSIDVASTGGGSPVIHYKYRNPVGGYPLSGQLIGGAGSRPWTGSDYSAHSTAAYHLNASETHTSTAQGTNLNLLATPIGATYASRVTVATANGEGDFISSKGQTTRKINAAERGRGFEVLRMAGGVLDTAEISMASNAPATYQTLFRGYALDGTLEAMTATWANRGTGFALCGHDGTSLVGAKALISLLSTDIWTNVSTPARIVLETTAAGSTARTQRWEVSTAGHLLPIADAAYDVGSASRRTREYFGANATINTSDEREKSNIRDFTQAELSCSSELASLVRMYQWNDAIEKKGEQARMHCSPTAQSVIACMKSHGLDPFRYGVVCFDEWTQVDEVVNANTGEVLIQGHPAGSRYALRPSELQFFIARGQEERLRKIEAFLNL